MSSSLQPQGLGPTTLLCPWNSPGKNSGAGGQSLLLGIFLTQGSNPGLAHCRQILYHLSHQGSPIKGTQGRWHEQGNGESRSPSATHHTHSLYESFPVSMDVPWWSSYYKIQSQMHSVRPEVTREGTELCMITSAHLSLLHSFDARFYRDWKLKRYNVHSKHRCWCMKRSSGSFPLTWEASPALTGESVCGVDAQPELLQKQLYLPCGRESSVRVMSFSSFDPRPKHTPGKSGFIRELEN